jgi:hypothetical protein
MKNRYDTKEDITIIYCEHKGVVMEVLIDTKDLLMIQQASTWYINASRKTYYCKGLLNGKIIQMHRFLTKCKKGEVVDHRDTNGLNNRRYNLKVCTNQQNLRNRGANNNTTSGHKGVSQNKKNGRWDAKIGVNGKVLWLGQRDTLEEAVQLRKEGEVKYW